MNVLFNRGVSTDEQVGYEGTRYDKGWLEDQVDFRFRGAPEDSASGFSFKGFSIIDR